MNHPTDDIGAQNCSSSEEIADNKAMVRKETQKSFSDTPAVRKTPEKRKSANIAFEKYIGRTDSVLIKIGASATEEKNLLVLLFAAILFSTLCHVIQILFFLFLGDTTLVIVNSFSICVYVVCTVLLVKKKPCAAGIIFSAEIAVVAVVISYLIGTDTFLFSYFFVVLLIQMIVPYAGWRIRIPTIVGILLMLLASFFIGNTLVPVTDITPIKTAYSIFNISIGAGSIIAIIAVSNTVHRIIVQFNKVKLDRYMDEAHLDALTGLYNRRYASIIFGEIQSDIEQHDAWCVAMIDIDDFKRVNDRYGHDFGDAVLIKLAEIMRTALRKTDYVFRWGGEEFLILLRTFDIDDAYRTLQKMREKINEVETSFEGQPVSVTVTIGLSKCSEGNIEESIKVSDRNLYRGKRAGKNVIIT